MALQGITFDNQSVAAINHAALFEGIISDGILRGCGVTFNGSVVTIGAGYIVSAGRLIRNSSDLDVSVSGTSGYAEIILKIDLSQTASQSQFSQVTTRVANSATQSFPALTQGDINGGTDSVYEISLCVVSLGAGGVTGVVSTLGTCRHPITVSSNGPTSSDGQNGDIWMVVVS